jgi:hypothetical protein
MTPREVVKMNDHLTRVLTRIGDEYKDQISKSSRYYSEVDIGRQAEKLGFDDIRSRYKGVHAIVPLQRPMDGMKVRIDGRTFVDYAQFDSGVVVAGYIAREAGLPFRTYIANDSMIRNFADA